MRTCVQHYSIIRNGFTALKIFCGFWRHFRSSQLEGCNEWRPHTLQCILGSAQQSVLVLRLQNAALQTIVQVWVCAWRGGGEAPELKRNLVFGCQEAGHAVADEGHPEPVDGPEEKTNSNLQAAFLPKSRHTFL